MEDKREAIRRGAIEVIADRGFHEATTRMIAQASGVAVGTLYNYFESKEEILAHIVELERSRRLHYLHELVEADLAPEVKLRKFLRMHFEGVLEDPATTRLIMREFRFTEREEMEPLRSYFLEIPAVIGRILEGECDEESAVLRGTALFGAVQAFTLQTLIVAPEERIDFDRVIDALVGIFLV